jgi:hypothetical protein
MKMKMWAMPLVLGMLFSACHLTDASVMKDDSACKGSACSSHNPIQHINTSVHGAKEDVSIHTDGSEYRYWYEASFQRTTGLSYGVLDITVTNDIFGGQNKEMRVGVPVVTALACASAGSLAELSGRLEVIDTSTSVQAASSSVNTEVRLNAIALDTYRIHYDYSNLAEAMGDCQRIVLRIPVYVSTP